MMPEISRRCLVCGASVRAGAHFCPQCGNSLSARGASPDAQPEMRAGARSDGEAAEEEPAREVAGGEEVARAFEAWRGGDAVAQDEARRTSGAAAEDEARGSVAGEAPRARAAVMTEPPKPEPTTPEPPAPPQSSPVADETDGRDAGGASQSSAKPVGAVGATRRRAASVVKESIAPRVERVRDRSIVMLDEAPDDSGLRFVLLAAVMFALFILLLVLSTVIK